MRWIDFIHGKTKNISYATSFEFLLFMLFFMTSIFLCSEVCAIDLSELL